MRLSLTVDQLVEHKYGKIIKKLTSEAVAEETRIRATKLYDTWSRLAKQEDSKRRPSTDTIAETTTKRKNSKTAAEEMLAKSAVPVNQAALPAGPVENLDFFSEAGSTAPVKTRAAMILERAARGESKSAVAVTTRHIKIMLYCCSKWLFFVDRPMSADDIHKAKRRRQYLQEAGVAVGPTENLPETEKLQEQVPDLNDPIVVVALPVEPKKRVSFANESDLVQIRYFEPEDDESGMPARKGSQDYHHKDRQEASYAFKRLQMEMEPETDWSEPPRLLLGEEAGKGGSRFQSGSESLERKIQEQRERTALSAVYLSLEHVPLSPSEHLLDQLDSAGPKPSIIPLSDADPESHPIVRLVPPVDRSVDTNLLTSLFSNPTVLQDLLKQTSRPPAAAPPFPGSFPVASGMPPPFPFPPLPLGFPMMPMMINPPVPLSRQQTETRPPPGRPKNACRFYQSGQPGSCKYGDRCTFLHVDY